MGASQGPTPARQASQILQRQPLGRAKPCGWPPGPCSAPRALLQRWRRPPQQPWLLSSLQFANAMITSLRGESRQNKRKREKPQIIKGSKSKVISWINHGNEDALRYDPFSKKKKNRNPRTAPNPSIQTDLCRYLTLRKVY